MGAEPLVEEKKVPVDWAEEEFGMLELGDQRRAKRLEEIARDTYAHPEGSVPFFYLFGVTVWKNVNSNSSWNMTAPDFPDGRFSRKHGLCRK